MNKIILSLMVLLVLSVTLSAQEPIRIGTVNSELIVRGFPQFQVAEQQLGREVEQWRIERAAWEADMERLQATILEREGALQAGLNTFSDTKKARMRTEIDSLQADFYGRMQNQNALEQERLNRRRAELFGEVFETVNEVITEIGEDNNYDIIIDSANGTIVYAKEPDELTEQVLEALQGR